MKYKFETVFDNWYEPAKVIKTYELEADTEREIFSKAFDISRGHRYNNTVYDRFADKDINDRWNHTSPTMQEYYGGGIVD